DSYRRTGRVERFWPDGTRLWRIETNGPIHNMRATTTRMWMCGDFTHVGDAPQWYVAAVDPEHGIRTPSFAPWPDRTVHDVMPLPNGDVLLGGDFTNLAVTRARFVAAVDGTTGALRTMFETAPRGGVRGFVEMPGARWLWL